MGNGKLWTCRTGEQSIARVSSRGRLEQLDNSDSNSAIL